MKEGDVVHKCNVCGHLGLWDENWSWRYEIVKVYGMPHEQIFKMCSDSCQEKDVKNTFSDKRRLPHNVKLKNQLNQKQ